MKPFAAGDKVVHPTFGIGTVVSDESDGRVKIDFDTAGLKKLLLRFAELRLESEGPEELEQRLDDAKRQDLFKQQPVPIPDRMKSGPYRAVRMPQWERLEHPVNFDTSLAHGELERIEISFDQDGFMPCGWIHFRFSAGAQREFMYCSNNCPPFFLLVRWLREIEQGTLPVVAHIDEERSETLLSAFPVADDRYVFVLARAPDSETPYFQVLVDRNELVTAFRVAFENFVDTVYDQELWGEDNCQPGEEPYLDLKWIRRFLDFNVSIDEFYAYPGNDFDQSDVN